MGDDGAETGRGVVWGSSGYSAAVTSGEAVPEELEWVGDEPNGFRYEATMAVNVQLVIQRKW